MHITDYLSIVVGAIGVILIPSLILLLRIAIKWTRTEDRLAEVVTDLEKMFQDKDKVHAAMYEQMRIDREATNQRLRFIEEWFMRGQTHAVR